MPVRLRVREIREAQGLSQRQLALSAGVRVATVHAMEKGTSRVDLEVLGKIADALGVDAALLIQHD